MKQWLFFFYVFLFLCVTPARVYVYGAGLVEDPEVSVPAGAYVTFSTVYNGKRYYLGIDTVQAKAGKDTVTWYDGPSYAAMWQAGGLYSPTGTTLDDENYLRTLKSVWIAERCSRARYLSLGTDRGTYSPVVLRDTARATLWFAQKDRIESGRFIEGYLYYYSAATGVEVYRYLSYDPLYGFSRALPGRPAVTTRMLVWERKTGNDLRFEFTPETYVFGLETTGDTTALPLTSKVVYFKNVDRFRSREGRMDVYAREPEVVDNQETLVGEPYNLFGYYEWASHPRTEGQKPASFADEDTYDGNSRMQYYNSYDHVNESSEIVGAWRDSTLLHVRNKGFTRGDDGLWHDTLYAIGSAPFDREETRFVGKGTGGDPEAGYYVDHMDYLRIHFRCEGEEYIDSALFVRQVFHEQPFTTLNLSSSPNDGVLTIEAGSMTFTIAAHYTSGNRILFVGGAVAETMILEEDDLSIDGDKLTIEVRDADGKAFAGEAWLTATQSGNTITATATANTSEANRVAQIRYTYHYVHSSATGDEATATRSLWITQKGKADGNAEIYVFSHKGDDDGDGLQDVHEKTCLYYAIPGEELQLPVHYDLWGYYRWFQYDGENKDRDLLYDGTWAWKAEPTNHLEDANRNSFMPINPTTDNTSHGRWDMAIDNHFITGKQTPVPSIAYPESDSKTGKVACEVSAYTDIDTTGKVGVSLTALTEPTLSYRQIFDIRPAKEQADKMADCRNGEEEWMERHTVIAPAGRAITLQQQYPVSDKNTNDVEDHLQYIYYYNATDANTGIDPKSNYEKAATYARIGRSRTEGDEHLDLIDFSTLEDGTYTVLMVNPRATGGYALGYRGSTTFNYNGWSSTISTAEDLKTWLERNVMKQNAYRLTLTKKGAQMRVAYNGSYITVNRSGVFSDNWAMQWTPSHWWANDHVITYSTAGTPSGTPSGMANTVQLHMEYTSILFGASSLSVSGYLHAKNAAGTSNAFHIVDGDDSEGGEINRSWVFYRIVSGGSEHKETPRWEKSTNNSEWTEVAREGHNTSGYTMLGNGYLSISENTHTNPNETVYYRLRTEHFQLAHFTLLTRDAAQEGPSAMPIIPEETMDNEYDILFSMTAENGHLPWAESEMSYHYPTATIAEGQRIFTTDEPVKGEYAFLPAFRGIGAIGGVKDDYLLCMNAADKPVMFMNFEYPQLPCSDQELFFVAELCNPVKNAYNPQITADMEGYSGGTWTPLYRFKTGEIPYNEAHPWYQVVMPIDRRTIAPYEKFRFVGYLSGSTESEAFVLMDHARFIAKARPVRVFQNRTTCLEGDSVDVVARIDYKHASYAGGTLIAFQYQKKTGDSYTPLTTAEVNNYFIEGMSKAEINDAACWLKDVNNQPCGMIMIPDASYNPATDVSDAKRGELINGISTRMGEESTAAATRSTTYQDESSQIRGIDEVVGNMKSYVNEGTEENPYHVMFLSARVEAAVNDTFRVAMTAMSSLGDVPNFSTSGCATERIVTIKNPVSLHVNGATAAWTNSTAEEDQVSANETYCVTVGLQSLPSGATANSGKAKFDLLLSDEWDRDYIGKDASARATADATFKTTYGISRAMLLEVLETFRADNEANPNRLVTNWNDVRPESFTWSGRTAQQADSIYAILNRLIVKERKLFIGLDSYEFYLGSNQAGYAYIQPLPASGRYEKGGETLPIAACNTPQWFEIHAKTAAYALRFGYDNPVAGGYKVPVIRATHSEANGLNGKDLKVRIAAITHDDETHTGVVIGWDSTYVVETNDPGWSSDKHFRYHQDRIVQDTTFAGYYHIPTNDKDEPIENDPHRYVHFTPVNAAYIALLNQTSDCDCDCKDYYPTATEFSERLGAPEGSPTGCNQWHVVAAKSGSHEPNNYTLQAGYWYKFKTAFFEVGSLVKASDGGDGPCAGHAEFILAVAPDTAVWNPSHPASANFWNDDDNWLALTGDKDTIHDCIATVPMGDTRVIIPAFAEENLLPIVNTDLNNIARRVDTMDYGFVTNTCRDILFKPNARMLGQENLIYTRAFVDVTVKTGSWQTFSPALKDIYTGDIYLPKNAATNDPDFAPAMFEDGTSYGADHNRGWPYLFYQGFYNTSVDYVFQNTDVDGAPLDTHTRTSANSAEWVRTNALDQPLVPGSASIILGFGPTDVQDSALIVRLPKQESNYHYIGTARDGYKQGDEASISRTAFEAITGNLAYHKDATGYSGGITYTLTNHHPSKVFFFGNPTLALIDVYKLCQDNNDKLEHSGDPVTYSFTAYHMLSGSSYATRTITGPGQFFIAPQQAVGLIAASEGTSLSITLTPDAMVAMTGEGTDVHHPFSAPRRAAQAAGSPVRRLYIAAANDRSDDTYSAYLTLGEAEGANRGFTAGEDALSLSSGNTAYNRNSLATPLSLYTVADNRALMLDMRDTIDLVPLFLGTLENVENRYTYSATTTLSFATDGEWDRPLYLYDALTNDSVLIVNGLQLTVETPLSDQLRYYINGSRTLTPEPEQPGVATGLEQINDPSQMSNVQSQMTQVFDLLGRVVTTCPADNLISNTALPAGVYIIVRGDKTERMVIR